MFIRQSSLGFAELQRQAVEPLPELSLIVDTSAVDMTVVEPSMLKRMFRALRSAVAPAEALADTAPPAGKGKGKMVEAGDSNFELWQKLANEALKGEQKLRQTPPHRLALEHPDQYVVVCEAGCRSANEEIVYAVAKAEARAVVTALEPTSAGAVPDTEPSNASDKDAPDKNASDRRVQSPDTILCLAGCYDSPRQHAARSKSAEAGQQPAQKFAAAASHMAAKAGVAAAAPGATVAPAAALMPKLPRAGAVQVRRVELASARPWQTRIIFETPSVRSAGRHLASGRPRSGVGAWQTKVSRAPASPPVVAAAAKIDAQPSWRTKVVFAGQQAEVAGKHTAHRGKLADVKHIQAAFAPLRKARRVQYAVVETRY